MNKSQNNMKNIVIKNSIKFSINHSSSLGIVFLRNLPFFCTFRVIVHFCLLYVLEIECCDYIKGVFKVIYFANSILKISYLNEVLHP